MSTQQHCASCAQQAQLICFCRKVLLCQQCVGRHLIDESALSHKPCLLSSTDARLYADHFEALRDEEDKIISEARLRRDFSKAAREKLTEGIKKLQDLRPVILDYVSLAVEVVTKQLGEVAEKLSKDMLAQCDTHTALLEAAMRHFEGSERHADNETVRLLEGMKSIEDMAGTEIVTCRLDLCEMLVEEMLRKGINFEVALKKPVRTEPLRHPSPANSRITGKSNIPKVSESAKKQKSEVKKSHHFVSRSSYALNSSVDYYPTEGSDGAPLRKKPEAQVAVPATEPTKAFRTLDFDESNTKPDKPSSEQSAQKAAVLEFSKKKSDGHEAVHFSRLQTLRTSTRSALLRDTEKKVEALESQLKSLKSSLAA